MTRLAFTRTELLVVVGLLALLLGCLGVFGPLELVLRVTFGWINFLRTVGPRIRLDVESTLVFGAALAAMTVGLHFFLAWFYRALAPEETDRTASTTPHWRWQWTMSAVAIVVMMFVAGTAMVGITHQATWLMTGPTSIFEGEGLQQAARRAASNNNLRQIMIGLMNYHDVYQRYPAGMSVNSSGSAQHGWLTNALPYFNISSETIDFAKPWNDPKNKPSFEVPVAFFLMPQPDLPKFDANGYALAHYAANVHVIGGTNSLSASNVTDGTANTILAGEAAGNYRPWGHPHNWRDPALGINASPDGFGSPWYGGAQFVMADGSVRFLKDEIDPAVLRALATPAGGEPVPPSY